MTRPLDLAPLQSLLTRLDSLPPSFAWQEERARCLLAVGRYFETHCRPGQPLDLRAHQPHPVWQLMEERLDRALHMLRRDPLPAEAWRLTQAYSSGAAVRVDQTVLGFDLVPLRRIFGWSDPLDMTGRWAQALDALFVTHRHDDHYDKPLVRACLDAGKPVYMPAHLAKDWAGHPMAVGVTHDQQWTVCHIPVHARQALHVWRDTLESVPLLAYEVACWEKAALLYAGDIDYTQPLPATEGMAIEAFFLPWRAPNARYEEGHPEQEAPLLHAVKQAVEILRPRTLFYEHCAELEHVYDGYPASFDLALDLKKKLKTQTELLFWGESMTLQKR